MTTYPSILRKDTITCLMNKKVCGLSGDIYLRGHRIQPDNLSVYNTQRSKTDSALGMGFVQAILAVLSGAVRGCTFDDDTRTGKVTIASLGASGMYQMSWDRRGTDLLLGGFINGPAYQAAMVGLVMEVVRSTAESHGDNALVSAWYTLLRQMDACYPRTDTSMGWDSRTIRTACENTAANAWIRKAIENVADELYFAMCYPLPDISTIRGVFVQESSVLHGHEGTKRLLSNELMNPYTVDERDMAGPKAPSTSPTETRLPDGDLDGDLDIDLDVDTAPACDPDKKTPPTTAPAAPKSPKPARVRKPKPEPSSAEESTKKADAERAEVARKEMAAADAKSAEHAAAERKKKTLPVVGTSNYERINRAFCRPGGLFLYGETATGKTMWSKQVAIANGWGLEIVVFKPGVKDEHVYGTSVQNEDRRWEWRDGPVVSWARRASKGEKVVLILDELARGHKSVADGVMDLLNTYTSDELSAMGIPIPETAGPYHIVRVFDTMETFVFPIDLVKIIATANLGDSYQGMDLSDPAFRRRWTAGFYQLDPYTPQELAQILAKHLDIPATHALISALIRADQEVQAYQAKEESLVMATNLAILINWGIDVKRWAATATKTRGRVQIKDAFITAAKDVWIDMVCPLKGSRRDQTVFTALVNIVTRHAPEIL